MGWADRAKQELSEGKTTSLRVFGRSMEPLINSGAVVTLIPSSQTTILLGDRVLVKAGARDYVHLVKDIQTFNEKTKYLIGNNKGGTNGWVEASQIFGKVVSINGD